MQSLVIVRGVPGSGKTTFAYKLLPHHVLVEADQYFVQADGSYVYDRSQLRAAHDWCYSTVKAALNNGRSVVVCNTFTRKWEYERYEQLAKSKNCECYILTMNGEFDNQHGVPAATVEKMKQRFDH